MNDRELMQQALDALEVSTDWDMGATGKQAQSIRAITALRARLAQPEQEMVAWVAYENGEKHGIDFDEEEIAKLPVGTMLYTAPPQREWQGLTGEEIRGFEIWLDDEEEKHGWNPPADIVKYIEAKLKEKNT